ncbi:MAG: hypothetical protein LBL08_02505, partial [Candidatus Nomurabacteria bacterium]|nr:hypothetical protein [Candidatus Nomurabacteria bacterium]
MDISKRRSLPVIAAVIIALVFTMAMPIVADAKSKAKVYKSGIYKVTVNYAKVNGKKKPKSVNIVGSDEIKSSNPYATAKATIPDKLKIKIGTRSYKLPVTYVKKLNTRNLRTVISFDKAKHVKKIGKLDAILLKKDGFICQNRDMPKGEVRIWLLYGKQAKAKHVTIPKKMFNQKVTGVAFSADDEYDYIDLSSATYLKRVHLLKVDLHYKGYVIRQISNDEIEITGSYEAVTNTNPS